MTLLNYLRAKLTAFRTYLDDVDAHINRDTEVAA